MPKAEISWKREDENGDKLQVYAQRIGGRWVFHRRHRRYDRWLVQPEPPLEDWLELLDAVQRMVPRRRFPPDEIDRVKQAIRERHPEAAL
jgi:hypothetical protein